MTALTPMPPEPEYRVADIFRDGCSGQWWYKNQRYTQTEAFREYHDDRAQALQERIRELAKYAEHQLPCLSGDDVGPVAYSAIPCHCGLTALMDTLRKEELI